MKWGDVNVEELRQILSSKKSLTPKSLDAVITRIEKIKKLREYKSSVSEITVSNDNKEKVHTFEKLKRKEELSNDPRTEITITKLRR